ncbi:MAG TPA: phosphoadenylyl-sulfate reductase [Acidimicrobiales bacterium]|nr:phosphoadenylyl-sulfate reductase [Acidimicrobiales bacterium]
MAAVMGREPDATEEAAPPGAIALAELAEVAEALETESPLEVLRWAASRFRERILVTSSFQDCVLVDLVRRVAPEVPIAFLDTGFHFPETLAYLRQVERRYGFTVRVVSAGLGPEESPCGAPDCCERRKVAPLRELLRDYDAWVTGVKRVDTPERADAPVVGFDPGKGVVKVNPIATWTEDDVDAYVAQRGLPRHPLSARGYRSIGCAPVTAPVAEGDHPRAGRWAGTGKTECGLHL